MSSIQNLLPHIYHERQEEGSMMCAQHALNNLLQGNYFTAADLSNLALSLDEEEAGFDDDNNGGQSTNMDDTGFFSVQVLLRALEVWGLDIVGWRGEAMRPYQDKPYTQLAFILNHQQHWYTLRRFGPASNVLQEDDGLGHWFNLNSLESRPQWIGNTFLEMQIQQAEDEGYSVFAVIQRDPEAPLALARTDADRIATTISATASSNVTTGPSFENESTTGFEDEDYELQAALQASLMGSSDSDFHPAPALSPAVSRRPVIPLPGGFDSTVGSGSGPRTTLAQPHRGDEDEEPDYEDEPTDPVAASMARNRHMLQQITAEQQYAQRELASQGYVPQNQQADFEEQLRRAIAESEAMARTGASGVGEEDIDVDMDTEQAPIIPAPRAASPLLGTFVGGGDRVYDDDDAELQAALRASLEHVPEGWTPPAETPPVRPSTSVVVPTPFPTPPVSHSQDDSESVMSDDTTPSSDAALLVPAEEPVDVEEMRRRRLARFGG